ncbi:MAG: tRNA dihydrouridine synthase DusB, partial [Myxococcaceae bacterium]
MSSTAHTRFHAWMGARPVVLAPMEDVSDPVFRRLCRSVGADVCVTEFVNVDALTSSCAKALKKIELAPEDQPTGIQIYGSDPGTLMEAAQIAERASPAFIDINCGCWIPRIAKRGAGAGWLKDPDRMVEMADQVVRAVSLPVTVKTRIGLGTEHTLPIVDLARRLEDVGVQALALHCRTANMRHTGNADWSWARRVREVVKMPVLVNGDIRSAEDAKRALEETGCAGVMVGRGAMDYPWVFREARGLLDTGVQLPAASVEERVAFCKRQLLENVEARGENNGVQCIRRHLMGYFGSLPGGIDLRNTLNQTGGLNDC